MITIIKWCLNGAVRSLGITSLLIAALLMGCGHSSNKSGTDPSSVARSVSVDPGVNCPNGGIRVDTGIDENNNGVLDDSEVDSSNYVCHGVGGSALALAESVDPEQCIICHKDQGQKHQDIYNSYKDTSALGLTITNVSSTGTGPYDVSIDFSISLNGQPYIDSDGLPSLDQKRFYATTYNSTDRTFGGTSGAENISFSNNNLTSNGDGTYNISATGAPFAPETSNAMVYAYIADGVLDTEGMTLYGDVANTAVAYGELVTSDANTYVSTANVSACEGCHGTPYQKHGYRAAQVNGLPDFAACKNCHLDDKAGSHVDWQLLVDNPVQYATYFDMIDLSSSSTDSVTDFMTAGEKTKYAYTRKLMNDVHMSHSMEFPYPQSMKNCATCHEGKLDQVLSDENFRLPVCKSCHAITGGVNATGTVDTTKFALAPLSVAVNLQHPDLTDNNPLDPDTIDCSQCHTATAPLEVAPTFKQLHSGYNSMIYTDAGSRYADAFTVSIDSASVTDNKVTFSFSATESPDIADLAVTDIAPTIMVGLYAYDTKHYQIYTHDRFDSNGDGTVDRNDKAQLEYNVGDTDHPYFTTDSSANGSWTVTVDLSIWSDKITDGSIKRIEIAVRPVLKDGAGTTLALNAPSRTFDLTTNGFDDTFYPDIVKVEGGCNNCHDALGTTFHSGDRGGNIKVCRMCHAPLAGGSHLELQSRSIDSYIHAVHSFAPFDPGDADLSDPVERVQFAHHIEHTFPNFTIKNCEACHNPGMFNPPDQGKSLPGVLSASDPVAGRSLGSIESVVTGPGARACGACHRQQALNEANDNKLIAVNAHTKLHGYAIPNETGVLDAIIERIMTMFN